MLNKLRSKISASIDRRIEKKIGKIIINQVSKQPIMNKFLTSIFGTSYRTALTGYATAIFTAILPYLQKGTFNIKTDWPYIVGAVGAAIFGSVSKDAAVSGKPDGTYNVAPTISQDLIGAQLALKTAQNEPNPNQSVIKALQAAVDELTKQAA